MMFTWAKQLFATPVFEDEEKARTAKLLNTILWIILVGLLVSSLFISIFDPQVFDYLITFWAIGTLASAAIGLRFLTQRGHVKLAGSILAFVLWLVTFVSTAFFDGIRDAMTAIYFLVIIIAGLFAGRRATFTFALLSVLTVVGLFHAEMSGIIIVPIRTSASAFDFIVLIVVLSLSALMLSFVVQSITEGFERARRNARALAESNRDLQQRNQQLLALQAAGAVIASSLDLKYVLGTVTREMTHLLKVEACAISEWDQASDSVALLAEYGPDDWWDEGSREKVFFLADYPLTKSVLVERGAQQITIGQPDLDGAELAYMHRANIKTLLMLPLVFQDRVVGLAEIMDRDECVFTEQERSLTQLLANQAASAIENARLYEQAQREVNERKQTEEALRESEKKYRHLVEHAPAGIYEIDLVNLKFASVNEVMCEYTGYSREEFLSLNPIELLTEDSRKLFIERQRQTFTSEQLPEIVEYKIKGKNDREFWVLLNTRLVHEQGKPVRATVVAHDITRRRQAEEEVKVRTRQQAGVAELGQRALVETDLAMVMDEAVSLVAQTLEVEYARILKLIRGKDILLLQAGVGWQEGLVGHARWNANSYSQEAGYTLLSGEPVIVADFSQEARFDQSPLLHDHQVVSSANVIIQGQNRPFGVLGADTVKRRKFTEDDLHFLQAVANVLATAMERQQAETAILQRKQELLALQSAGTAITSSLDLQEVLHTVAQTFSNWLGMAACSISEWNPDDDTVSTLVDYGPEVWSDEAEEIGKVFHLADYPLTRQVLVERCPQQMTINQPDIDPAELAYMEENGIRMLLMLPMIFQERVIGLVEVMDDWATRTFTIQEIALGQLLANQAASAIENARLYAETRRRLAEQTALRGAGTIISSTLDLESVLSHIAEQMGQAIDATSAYICSYDLETTAAPVLAEYIGPHACPEEQISDLNAIYVEDDVEFVEAMQRNRPSISHVDDPDLPQPERDHMQQYGARTILYIPLQIRGQPIAYAELWESRQKREFAPEEIALCQGIGQQAAIAIENARLYQQAQQEIAERRRAEEKVKVALEEKEVLLKEIHHRVKNNLQVVSSLLHLQSSYAQDQQTVEIFEESQHRVRTMALVHETLYQSQDLARIDISQYIQDLTTYLARSYETKAGNIQLRIEAESIFVSVDVAVPCGLILNELVSNSLKHAFPEGRKGNILVELSGEDDRQWILKVSDDGVGFPGELDFRNTTSLGLQLVNALVSQLDGTIELDRSNGTEFKIRFPL